MASVTCNGLPAPFSPSIFSSSSSLYRVSNVVKPPQMAYLHLVRAEPPQMDDCLCLAPPRFKCRRQPAGIAAAAAAAASLAEEAAAVGEENVKPAITLTEKALKHLQKLRGETSRDLCLRIGVRQGGCSGMSYTMDFEQREKVRADDSITDYDGFIMVCDPKSLLFLYGMQLDYSDALIGGGFSFSNPNASSTCGCGKSFAA